LLTRAAPQNEPPTLGDASFSIDENSGVGTNVGARMVGTDEDIPAQTLKYTIASGNDGSAFEIDLNTGQIRVQNDVLDFESQSSYTLVVVVTGAPAASVARPAPLRSRSSAQTTALDSSPTPPPLPSRWST